jgi:hypothetical protein
MSMEDMTKAPSGCPPGGAEEGHSLAASDGKENRPDGSNSQADSAPDLLPWWLDPEFALANPELFIWTHHDDGTISCRPAPDPADIDPADIDPADIADEEEGSL